MQRERAGPQQGNKWKEREKVEMTCHLLINKNNKPESNGMQKPPLGLKPYKMHNEERAFEIIEAMKRYNIVNKRIPPEWFCELKNLYGIA